MACLSIRSFGPLEFALEEQPLTGIEYNKVRALLLVLALEPDRAHTRAALCALLWPELPEKSARNNLSQALTNLRKVFRDQNPALNTTSRDLIPPLIHATNEAIQLHLESDIAVEVDASQFEKLVSECEHHTHPSWHTCARCTQRLAAAIALYHADFLKDFSLPDSAEFEEWAQVQREAFHQQAITALQRLTRAAEWRGQPAQAIEYARRQAALDPLNEASHRDLLRLLARNDQLPAARSHYEDVRGMLARELGDDAEPEPETQQLLAKLNPTDAPKLPSLQAPPSTLPIPPAQLIGREADEAAVINLLRESGARLITLIGPAGVGKTRMALQLAHALRFDYTDGAHFIELAPLKEAAQVLPAIAQALNLKDETQDALVAHLQRKHMLLVLDNFEHILGAEDGANVSSFIAEKLSHAPALALLITSRSALRIRAEQQYALAPLAQPAATQLFVDRARAAHYDFALTPNNAGDIAAICQRLDGLPLAIELIAARVGSSSTAKLAQQLGPLLPLLADGPRDVPERHRTLHDAINWSVQLLSETQQKLFAHLAVFAGGFDEAAANAVFAHSRDDLDALTHNSLIQKAGDQRWRMLEPVRQFAEALMTECGEAQAAYARHAAHFVALTQTADAVLLGTHAAAWMARLEADHANLQAASQWALRTQQPEISLRIGQGIFRFWFRRGWWREGLVWLEQALAMEDPHTPLAIRAYALRAAGVMAMMLSLYERADAHLLAGLQLAQRLENDVIVASALNNLGTLRKDQGQFEEALAYFDQSIGIQPPHTLKFPWQNKADTLMRLGRFDEAKLLYEKAMALNREIGDGEGLAHTLRGLAQVALLNGDADTAEPLLRENEAICHTLQHTRGLSWTTQLFGRAAQVRGHWQKAREHYTDALAQMDAMGDTWGRYDVLADLGHLAVAEGDCALALHNLQQAQEGWRELGAKLTPFETGLIEASLERCKVKTPDPTL